MQKKHFLIVALALLVSLLVLANLPIGRQWLTSKISLAQPQTILLPQSPCDLAQAACNYPLPNGDELSLDIQPKPIRPMHPLQLAVIIKSAAPQPNTTYRVKAELTGTNMDMGLTQTTLSQQTNGAFIGEISIPVCTTGKMRWQMMLILDGPSQVRIPFLFDAG